MPRNTPHRLTPQEAAARIIADAPDEKWVRRLVDDLDRQVRTAPLERLMSLWALSAAQTAQLFNVSRQAFAKWLKAGPPAERAAAVASLASATDLLDRYVKRERIAAVIRRPASQLGGRSILEMAGAGRYAQVHEAVERMFDLRRIQP